MVRRILRDDQWSRIEQKFPGKSGDPGRSGEDSRLFVEAWLRVARPLARFDGRIWLLKQCVQTLCPLVEQRRMAARLLSVGHGHRF